MSLEITTGTAGEDRLVSVAGEVDVSCADELRAAIDAQIAEGVSGARPQRNVARVLGLLGVQADLNIREA